MVVLLVVVAVAVEVVCGLTRGFCFSGGFRADDLFVTDEGVGLGDDGYGAWGLLRW